MRRICRLVPLLALFLWCAVSATPAAAVTALAVTPSTDLVDGQVVAVSGTGFVPGTQIGWCQGVRISPDPSNCGTPLGFVNADDQGAFSTMHAVQRFMFVPILGRTVDCTNAAEGCIMGAAQVNDIAGTVAYSSLRFVPAPPVVLPGVGSTPEGDVGTSAVEVPVNLSAPFDQTVTVAWTTLDVPGAPGSQADPSDDYTATSGTVAFIPGETTKTVSVPVDGDIAIEPDEYVVVSFTNPTNAVMGGYWGLGFGVIENDDALPTVVAGVGSVTEGSSGTSTLIVPVTLSASFGQMVTVEWTTLEVAGAPGAQAVPPGDYASASGTVSFAPGETTKTVSVPVNGDIVIEPDEYVVVSFTNPTNAVMGGYWGLGFGVIQNDD